MKNKLKIIFATIIIVGVFAGGSAYALNDIFNLEFIGGYLSKFDWIDPDHQSNCVGGTYQYNLAAFDQNGLMSNGGYCDEDVNTDGTNFNWNPFTLSKNSGDPYGDPDYDLKYQQQGQYSTSGTIYAIRDIDTGDAIDCWQDGWDYGESGFLSCVSGNASASIMFSESYPDVYGDQHSIFSFVALARDVSVLIFTTLLSLMAVAAALLGLGFAIARVKRYITGRKA